MPSRYQLAVIDLQTGETVATWLPGLEVEHDFVDSLCTRVQQKGVGLGKSTAHVVNDVRAAMQEILYELKSRVR